MLFNGLQIKGHHADRDLVVTLEAVSDHIADTGQRAACFNRALKATGSDGLRISWSQKFNDPTDLSVAALTVE